ncbi:MAG: TRAP transporter large permease subunit [Bilophila sp.]
MIPAMVRRGFSRGYAAAAAATAGAWASSPPSVPLVVYGVAGQQSITKLFSAA